MSDETGADPYEAVLADLRAKREKIDEAITVLEAVRGGGGLPSTREAKQPAPEDLAGDDGGQFLGMTIVDATKKLLASKRKMLANPEIATALKGGGLVLQSAEPANTIGSVLTRRFNDVGDIVRVGRGRWGLREWYPHQSFKKKGDQASEGAEATAATKPPSVGDSPSDHSQSQT